MQITKSRISRNADEHLGGGTLSRSRSPTQSALDFYKNKSRTMNPTYDLSKPTLRDRSRNAAVPSNVESLTMPDDRSQRSIHNNFINIEKYRDRLRSRSNTNSAEM